MKSTKKKLTATTPWGTFTRTTDHPYTFVSVFGVPDAKHYKAEIARMALRGTTDTEYMGHCQKQIKLAADNANNPAYVSEVKWHSSRKLAEGAKPTYTITVKSGVAPVDVLDIENNCGFCGEAYEAHRTASGNTAPYCMTKDSRPGDTFIKEAR